MAQPAKSGYTRARGGALYFEVYGPTDGPSLMIFNLGTSRDVAPDHHAAMQDGLSDDYRLIFWDYPPGLGGSPPEGSARRMTPSRVADDYLAVADAAGAETFAYPGYSYGGNSGLQFAARHGARINAARTSPRFSRSGLHLRPGGRAEACADPRRAGAAMAA